MADQENRAVVIGQQLFKQLQCFDVQVIGRLVEYQHIGRPGEQARQQQAVALTAGQTLDRRIGTRWRKQEVAQIALDMLALIADLDPLATRADRVGQGRFHIERIAHLVEIGHVDLRAHADIAAVRREFAQNHLQQGGLASAVRADQTDLVTAQDGGSEIADDGLVAIALEYILELGNDLAAGAAGIDVKPYLALHVAP